MANINVEVLISAKDQASAVLKKFQNTSESAGAQLSQTFKTGGLAAGIFLTALTAVGKAAVDVASDFEQSSISFETMLGSAEAARKTLKQLSDFARTTPFEFPELVEASKRLLAYGITADDLIPTLTNLGNITAGVGRDKLPQLILAFGQVKAATVLTGAELRQFSEAGVPLLDTLAKQAGKSAAEMKDAISDGAVSFDDVNKALQSLSGEGGKFFNLMEKQSKSFGGVMSNISDQVTRTMLEIVGVSVDKGGEIRKGSIFAVLKEGAEAFLNTLSAVTPKLVEFSNWVAQNQTLVIGIAGAIAGVLVLAIGALIVTFGTAIATMAAFAALGAGVAIQIKNIYDKFQELKAGLEQIVPPIQQFFEELPVRVGETITAIGVWFGQLPGILAATWVKTWTQDVPAAFGFIAGYLSTAIPQLITNIGIWLAGIPPKVQQVFTQFRTDTQARVTETAAWLQAELSSWPGRIYSFIISIPSIVMAVFNSAKNAVLSQMSEMFAGVSGWWDKIKGILNAIRDAANAAIDAVSRGFAAGQKAGGGRQAGGIVPGPRDEPRLILAHGGEEVTPIDKRGTSGGESAGMSFTVNIGLYAGGEIEKRNIARELYASLVQLAAAENKSVAEMMGR